MWTDASDRMRLAKRSIEAGDYAVAIRESQACIERIVKSLLDDLGVNYKERRRGKESYHHDVSKRIPEAFEKLEPRLHSGEIGVCRMRLAQAAVLLRLLTSIKSDSEFGIQEMGLSATHIFDASFAKDLSNNLFRLIESTYGYLTPIKMKLSLDLGRGCSIVDLDHFPGDLFRRSTG